MLNKKSKKVVPNFTTYNLWEYFFSNASEYNLNYHSGNRGLPGNIDLPTANSLPVGEIVLTQQIHRSLARTSLSFQPLPKVGFTFNYSGHGKDGGEAYGRINHDRSFDAHISLLNEDKFVPKISIGLRDFIGTGWYSSEYIVGTKTIGELELSVGLGFGRLAGHNQFKNPLGSFQIDFWKEEKNLSV